MPEEPYHPEQMESFLRETPEDFLKILRLVPAQQREVFFNAMQAVLCSVRPSEEDEQKIKATIIKKAKLVSRIELIHLNHRSNFLTFAQLLLTLCLEEHISLSPVVDNGGTSLTQLPDGKYMKIVSPIGQEYMVVMSASGAISIAIYTQEKDIGRGAWIPTMLALHGEEGDTISNLYHQLAKQKSS